VTAQTSTSFDSLNARLNAKHERSTIAHLPDVPAWRNSHLTNAAMPVATLKSIVAWMS
jgi:hypothetical protein